MSVLLRHPGAVPALFSREVEADRPQGGIVALWRGVGSRRRGRLALPGVGARGRAPGWVAVPLMLLCAEAPLIKAAALLLSMAWPP
jgi:hypothetical protein